MFAVVLFFYLRDKRKEKMITDVDSKRSSVKMIKGNEENASKSTRLLQ